MNGAAFLILGALSVSGARAGEAVSYLNNPQHTGSAMFDKGLKLPILRKWSRTLPGPVSYPLIAQGKVFASARPNLDAKDSKVYALDLKTGKTDWIKTIPDPSPGPAALSAYDDGALFVVSNAGKVYALDPATGSVLWEVQLQTDPQSIYTTPPVAAYGTLVVVLAGTVTALRESDGAVRWSEFHPASAAVLADDGLFLADVCDVSGLDAASGSQRWDHAAACGGGGDVDAELYSGLLYTAADDVYDLTSTGFDLFNGKSEAHLSGVSDFGSLNQVATPSYQDGKAYIVTNTGLTARSIPGNKLLWQIKNDHEYESSVVAVDGIVIAPSLSGHVYVVSGENGLILQTLDLPVGKELGPSIPISTAAGEEAIAVPAGERLTVFTVSP